jgi:predicted nucleotidyltransferase
LFGSRAIWNYKNNSDYDIWILWKKRLTYTKYLRLKRLLNELPCLVDVVDFNMVDEDFKTLALKKIIKWN